MPTKIPGSTSDSTALFLSLIGGDSRFVVKKLFGNPAAFVGGNLCIGTFGPDVFLRLSEEDQARAAAVPGVRPFEPMLGRPMKSYLVLPTSLLADPKEGKKWVDRALKWTLSLPPKKSKKGR
jgi:TfoX/Sxy family transcriptional regulator of competence genes